MTPIQLKMARAASGLGVRELAAAAGVAPATVTRLETGKGGINTASTDALRDTLKSLGVQFMETGDIARGAGVAFIVEDDAKEVI